MCVGMELSMYLYLAFPKQKIKLTKEKMKIYEYQRSTLYYKTVQMHPDYIFKGIA